MQPIQFDARGVVRFRANAIVRWMLDMGGMGAKFDLNAIAVGNFSREDAMQLAQLLGYSVSGYGDLPYASKKSVRTADDIAAGLVMRRKAGRKR
jgi:hypothetical protein